MKDKKYIGVYYPNAYIENKSSLTTFGLLFDELHLITISDIATNPTSYLKELPKSIKIRVIGGSPTSDEVEKAKNFYQFALDNQELIGRILFYHPHLIDTAISSFSSKLLSGKLTQDEFLNFFAGETEEQKAFKNFANQFPNLKDKLILNTSSTAIKLAEDNDWILVSDNPEMPIPYLSAKNKTVKYLTTILAEECIRINLPQSISLNAEDILLARDKLKELLIPFRMSMQKLSATLKTAIKDSRSFDEIRAEAKFIAESQVEPALYELKRKIEIEKDKLWIKIFGNVVSWIPLVAKGFAAPTPDNIFKAMEKVYGDIGSIADNIQNIDIAKEPGMCYLLKLDEIIKGK